MLEHRTLLLRPWTAGDPDATERDARARADRLAAGRVRAIHAAETGEGLGHACWRSGGLPAWLSWLSRPVLEVYETEDASLLCTVHRRWGLSPAWGVCDADGHEVGTLWCAGGPTGRCLLADRWGQGFARIDPPPDGQPGQFLAPAGEAVATLRRAPDGALLTFDPALDPNPFAKMIVLAAALQF
jgi:hypothetical protein